METIEDEACFFQKLFFGLRDGIVLQSDVHMAVERRLMDDEHVRPPSGGLSNDIRRGEHGDGDASDRFVRIAAFDGVTGFGIVSCRVGPGFKLLDEFCCGDHVFLMILLVFLEGYTPRIFNGETPSLPSTARRRRHLRRRDAVATFDGETP